MIITLLLHCCNIVVTLLLITVGEFVYIVRFVLLLHYLLYCFLNGVSIFF
jgi:hypothetical protein